MWVQSLAYLRGSGVATSCGAGRRHGSDPVLLWAGSCSYDLTLAPELPYAIGVALKKQKGKKQFGLQKAKLRVT